MGVVTPSAYLLLTWLASVAVCSCVTTIAEQLVYRTTWHSELYGGEGGGVGEGAEGALFMIR